MDHRDSSLEQALRALTGSRAVRGRALSKAELLALLPSVFSGDAAEAFAAIRAAAKGAREMGNVRIESVGERRGTRYVLRDLSADLSTTGTAVATAAASEQGLHDLASPQHPSGSGTIDVFLGDNLKVMAPWASSSFELIYIDPPFNTGREQARTRLRTERDDEGDRVGYQGRRYRTTVLGSSAYADRFDDYLGFLVPRLREAHRLLTPTGSLFLHLDYREVHYAKVALDEIFGRASFINEIIWAYDYGARATKRWSPKHDNILWYAKDPERYCFHYDEIDRIPYLAPSLVGDEKAARGKTPTDCWWHTIVSPTGKEKTGYPTQKPLGVLKRIVRVHSSPGDRLLDFFAGSGSFGEAGASLGRLVTLVDENPEAIAVMRRRFADYRAQFFVVDEERDPSGAPTTGVCADLPANQPASAERPHPESTALDASSPRAPCPPPRQATLF